jgi:hypothetical protein
MLYNSTRIGVIVFSNILNIVVYCYHSEIYADTAVDTEPYDITELVSDDDEEFLGGKGEIEHTGDEQDMEIPFVIFREFHR